MTSPLFCIHTFLIFAEFVILVHVHDLYFFALQWTFFEHGYPLRFLIF